MGEKKGNRPIGRTDVIKRGMMEKRGIVKKKS